MSNVNLRDSVLIKVETGIPLPSSQVQFNREYQTLIGLMRPMLPGDSFLWTADTCSWPRSAAKTLGFKLSVWLQQIVKYPDPEEDDPHWIFTWRIWRVAADQAKHMSADRRL